MFGLKGGKEAGWKMFLFGWREKGEDGKCSLYKLTIMSLLYNSGKVRGVGECNKVGVFSSQFFTPPTKQTLTILEKF